MDKIVFIDVDGTLLPKGSADVPKSTVRAISELQKQDIGVVLCTGRHPLELQQLGLLKYPFDGYVLLNGQLVLDKQMHVISARTIDDNDRDELIALFESKQAPMILVETDRLFMNFHNDVVRKVQEEISSPVYDVGSYQGDDVFMATIFVPRGEEKSFSHLVCSRWHADAMDIFLPDGGKVYGMKRIMELENVFQGDTIAFGDGDNDIEMLKFAGLGIAMGNAPDNVKAEADYITSSADQDGIEQALMHYRIIYR